MIGKDREKLVNSRFGFFVSDDTKKEFNRFLTKIFERKEKEICEIVLMRNDEIRVEIVLTGIADDERSCMVTAITTTETNMLERILVSKEHRLQMAITSTGIGIYSYDFISNTAEYSKEFLNIYGLKPEETIELDSDLVPKAVYPEDKDYLRSAMETANDPKGSGILDIEFRIKTADGEIKWLKSTGLTVFGFIGGIKKLLNANGIIRDITARKGLESDLKSSLDILRMVTENITDVVWVMDPETMRFLYVSPSVEKLRGYTPEEVMAESVISALSPESAENVMNIIRLRKEDRLSGKETDKKFYINEIQQPCKDGSIILTEVITNYFKDPDSGQVRLLGVEGYYTAKGG
jgi:PAS domain S-box-containing protein